jgi:hypothetical protein
MLATVTDLTQYRNTHPPIVRLWNAQCRMLSAWYGLSLRMSACLLRPPA